MKKALLFLALMAIVCNIFARGNIYFFNVGQIHDNNDLIRFKLVVHDWEKQTVKELYTDEIPAASFNPAPLPEEVRKITKEQLDVKYGEIDYYIENVTKNTGFKKCDLTWEYSPSYHTRIGGWDDGCSYSCHTMEDL